ncbi:MFS transporter [Streptomyces sp. NPDC057509]|uniref:MFS transporter n=1 Tax=Streptomyces sp. NPDC057509 TaxID=3346152 RepID=UPI003682FAD0
MSATASPTSAQSPHRPGPSSHLVATTVLACLGVFVSYLLFVGVAVSLPVIQQALSASTTELQWITDVFLLPSAALLLTCGVLGDIFGRKKVYLAGLTLLVIGCLVCLTATSVLQLCVGQALSGIGTAALMPSTLALLTHVCTDRRQRTQAIALWTASLGLGLTLGPLMNGVIVDHASWRWIFLPCVVIGVLIAVAGAFLLVDSRAERARHLDIPGQLLAIVAIAALIYAVIEGGVDGWGSARVIIAFAVAAVTSAAFVVTELRSTHPMFDMRLFSSLAFSGTATIMCLTLFAQVGLVFILSEYFGLVQHASTLDIAIRLVALNGFTVVLGPLVGRLMIRTTPGLVLVVGLVVAGIGALLITTFGPSSGALAVAAVIGVLGIGIALATAPITTIAVNSLPPRLAPTAGAASNALRQIGSALGPAVFGVLLTRSTLNALPDHLAASSLGAADKGQVLGVVSDAGIQAGAFLRLSSPSTTAQAQSVYAASFTDALHACALVGGIGLLAGAVIALVTVGVRKAAHNAAAGS